MKSGPTPGRSPHGSGSRKTSELLLIPESPTRPTTRRACYACAKSGMKCSKSTNVRRTACKRCSSQKKQCSWTGTSRPRHRRPVARSPISKADSEQPQELLTAEAIDNNSQKVFRELEKIRQEVRSEFANLRAEVLRGFVNATTSDSKMLGRIAACNLDVSEMLTLLRAMDARDGGGAKRDDAEMDVEQ